MSDIDSVYNALMAGKRANESLESWVKGPDARDSVRSMKYEIEQGIAAYERLRADLRDGRKHVEPPDDYKHTSCYCSAPTCSPPCSFCESGAANDLDEFDNPLDGQMGG